MHKPVGNCIVHLLTLLIAGLTTGCSDETSLPPERPKSVVSGKVVDGVVSGAQVALYTIANGARGGRLATAVTNDNGNYSGEVQAPSQLILIEAGGGSYTEQATVTTVTIPEGQVLRSIAAYQSGQPLEAMVTPLTHLVAGLTLYKAENGAPLSQAYSEAKTAIDEFFTIDTSAVTPIDITNSGGTVNGVSSEALYGFYLAGLSSWSAWAGDRNNVTPHTVYHSIGVTQIMYNDIHSDGKLDGIGFDLNRNNLMPLAVGVVPLDTETYRAIFSLHLLAVANIPANTTNLKPGDLQLTAEDLATKSSVLFADQDTLDINNQAPTLSPAQSLQPAYGGVMTLQLNVGGYLGAQTISTSIDGNFLGDLQNTVNPQLVIDTADGYSDGEHIINLSATDALGNTASTNVIVAFDNTNPIVNVTSPGITNIATPVIRGTYSDNLSGVSSIIVNGQSATLDQNGNWEAQVAINPGENIIPVTVVDNVNNQAGIESTVFLDIVPPVIDTANGHSSARFSIGNGGYITAPLQTVNESIALYLETNRLELNGTPIQRAQLDSNLIPYFAFLIADEREPGDPTPFADITARVRYEKNGVILEDWRVLPPPISGDEYLVPLASETLTAQWHQAIPADTHAVRVQVSDPAGNFTELAFTFRADFYVPSLPANEPVIQDLNPVSGVAFDDRASLRNAELETMTYTFTNPGSKAVFIQPADTSTHTAAQTVAEELRHHRVTKTTAAQWRVGLAASQDNNDCPVFDGTSWQENITSIWNWNGADWERHSPSEIIFSPVDEEIFTDDLASLPISSAWAPTADFDSFHSHARSGSLEFDEDYKLFIPLGTPALVVNATVGNQPCPDQRNFDQREVYSYVSLAGYPRDEVTNLDLSGLPDFSTTGFTVIVNGNAAESVQPVNGGWYLIPANAEVTITKRVTTPALTFYNDNFDVNASYTVPSRRDLSISWFVNRHLEISMIHDAGEVNIPDMPQRQTISGAGTANYQINR
ncbi:MAG: hypothetical protein L0Z73_19195 [Gammaproteobacteria bacterium]|nr:hypothetical protein [Gammaproteobacteria bacterium]